MKNKLNVNKTQYRGGFIQGIKDGGEAGYTDLNGKPVSWLMGYANGQMAWAGRIPKTKVDPKIYQETEGYKGQPDFPFPKP